MTQPTPGLSDAEHAEIKVTVHDAACGCDDDPVIFPKADATLAAVAKVKEAGRQAGREEVVARVEALHSPFRIYDECDHRHPDEDVAAGRAVDIPEIGYT